MTKAATKKKPERGVKSAAIRSAKAKVGSKAADIVAECAKQGITVKPGLVYNVLGKGKKSKRRRNKAEGHVGNGYMALDAAVVYLKKCGSMQEARQALSTLGKITAAMSE